MSVVEGSSPAGTTIFRAAAIERMSTPERLDMAAGIVRPAAWMILAAGLIVVQMPGGRLEHFDWVGYIVVAVALVSLVLMYLLHKQVPEAAPR